MPTSHALAWPRRERHRTKPPERWSIAINDANRPILIDMIRMLRSVCVSFDGDPSHAKHLDATRRSIALLQDLVERSPKELLTDPDDFVQRSILSFLDETCWALVLKEAQRREHEASRYAGFARVHLGGMDGYGGYGRY